MIKPPKSLLLLSLLLCTIPLFSQIKKTFALAHVSVIDVRSGMLNRDMTVVVEGNRIIAVKPSQKVAIPKKAKIMDESGKFLIPGLWDMHVHTFYEGRPELFFPMFIANGVTGIREMASSMPFEKINSIRRQIKNGEIIGPRIEAVAGKLLDATAWGPEVKAVTTPAEARKTVREYKAEGADFIKVYDHLSRPVYFAVIDEAKKQHLPFEGHLPVAISATEASNAGQKSMEHLIGIIEACSSKEKELKRLRPSVTKGEQILNSFDETRAQQLFQRFATNKTYQCPTLVFTKEFFDFDSSLFNDPRLIYIPLKTREGWKDQIKGMTVTDPFGKVWFSKLIAIVNQMNQLHVPLLAGTDVGLGNPYTFAGFSLHEELASLVRAGLTPLEALQTATLNPAKFLNKENQYGTVETGKLADLVLLDANPLDDIHNTEKITAVVANGKYFSRAELDELLAKVKATAGKR